jgi:transposase InsO family protein
LFLAIDKFLKLIEVHPISNLRSEQAVLFFTDIVHRFGLPNSIITDNGTQFTGRKFLELCDSCHIRMDWSAVAHPQMNSQVERTNGMIIQGLKPRIFNKLNKFGRKWIQELLSVIWSIRTTLSRSTGFTLSFNVYVTEAVLPHGLGVWVPEA